MPALMMMPALREQHLMHLRRGVMRSRYRVWSMPLAGVGADAAAAEAEPSAGAVCGARHAAGQAAQQRGRRQVLLVRRRRGAAAHAERRALPVRR